MVAHSLSLINVQAGVALELMDQRPEQIRTALSAIKHASREALVDVESVLDSLRLPDEEVPRAPAPNLRDVEDWYGGPRQPVSASTWASPADLPRGGDAAGYRIVQEAQANVVRHADASSVRVRIGPDDGDLLIEVVDDRDERLALRAAARREQRRGQRRGPRDTRHDRARRGAGRAADRRARAIEGGWGGG